jgi:antitoxin YobK
MAYRDAFDTIEQIRVGNPGLVLFASGVEEQWVRKAEEALGVQLPPSFVYFLTHYGGATIGGEVVNGLLGIEFDDACGPDIVYNTLLDRQNRGLDPSLVVLVDNDGDEFFYLQTGLVDEEAENPVLRELIEEKGTLRSYAANFAEFLLLRVRFCLAGQA